MNSIGFGGFARARLVLLRVSFFVLVFLSVFSPQVGVTSSVMSERRPYNQYGTLKKSSC